MRLACLDLEGVLVPEIWQNVARKTGIDELMLTTRDIPDYHDLMRRRLAILAENDLRLADITDVIATMHPMEGARAFLDDLRSRMQVVILSDTFVEFADPLMAQLNRPTLLCNSLEISSDGRVANYRLRQENGKYEAVRAFRSLNLEVLAAGDSYNDLAMLLEADAAALFRAPDSIRDRYPNLPAYTAYDDLLSFLVNHQRV